MQKVKLLLNIKSLLRLRCQKLFLLLLFLVPVVCFSQGVNMSNPLVMGNYSGGNFSYNDTRNNSGYGNDYGQASDDIFYRFTVQGSTDITISTCASGFDTYLHLLNSGGTLITSNDDNGPLCTGLRASISTTLAVGTYYIVAEGYGSNTGLIYLSVNLTVTAPPAPVIYNTKNFLRTWEALAPETDPNALITKDISEVRQSTAYFDGLGRPEQTVMKKGSMITGSSAMDLIAPVVYDAFGRETEKYLPYVASTNDGLFKTGALTAQNSFYVGAASPLAGQGETYFYGKTDFEASPLKRVMKTMAPGNSWVGSGRGVSANYWINAPNDAVRIWDVSDPATPGGFGSYTSSLAYPAGELYKNVTEDEHGKQVIEFKDKEGKVILKKVQLTDAAYDDGTGKDYTGWLCTYYIYDDLGQLRCVVQPKGVELLLQNSWNMAALSGDILNEQCFRYEYDARGRMIQKIVPGVQPVYMIYDQRDRLVMTQDGNLRNGSQWLITLYDELNRPLITGKVDNSAIGNKAFQSHLVDASTSTAYPFSTPPSSGWEMLTETHYDDYTNLLSGLSASLNASGYTSYLTASSSAPDYAEPLTASTAVKGMVTWTKVKVLGENKYLYTATIYDEKGRVIQVQSINYTGGLDVATNQYSFAGQVLRSHIRHEKQTGTAQTYNVGTKNNYDDLNRVVSIEKSINGSAWKMISSLAYDALGQVKKKNLGTDPANGSNPLETLVYDYNIRGWMLGANRDYAKSASTGGSWFGFDLGYDKQTITSLGSYAQGAYNGNITGTVWKSKGDGEIRKYDFTYDAVNRLTGADFNQYTSSAFTKTAGLDFSVSNLSYDANGNILTMNQKGWKLGGSNYIDQLSYSYTANSNKLLAVTDAQNDNSSKLGDFKYDAATKGSTDYTYDVNGNMVSDANKKINSIAYNYLNLPQTITVSPLQGEPEGAELLPTRMMQQAPS